MRHHTLMTVTGAIFLAIGLLHLARIVWGWSATIDTFIVPDWFSWIICPLALFLAWESFRYAKKS